MLNKLGLGYGGVTNQTVLVRSIQEFLGPDADVRCSREWENKVEVEINVEDETVYLEYTLCNGKIKNVEVPEMEELDWSNMPKVSCALGQECFGDLSSLDEMLKNS